MAMARQSRLLACAALVVMTCALLHIGGSSSVAQVPTRVSGVDHLSAWAVRTLTSAIQAALTLLPFVGAAYVVYTFATQRQTLPMKTKGGLAVLLLIAIAAIVHNGRSSSPSRAEKTLQDDMDMEAEGPLDVEPYSGEEVLMSDGSFIRMADPSLTEGQPLTTAWRQNLATALVTTISRGEEQAVIMFTRQGCPWCDKQLPVFQEAIRRRAEYAAAGAGAVAGAAFVGGGGASGLLDAPLRVFVLDAEEFPQLVQGFRVEGFPTSIIFGRPRVTPLIGRGFMDLESFEGALKEAALAEPEPEDEMEGDGAPAKKIKKRGFFGLR